jgi:hypothetical protein
MKEKAKYLVASSLIIVFALVLGSAFNASADNDNISVNDGGIVNINNHGAGMEGSLGGSTSDNWNVGGNLAVTGTSALTGAVTMSGALTVASVSSSGAISGTTITGTGAATVGNLNYGATTVASSTSNATETMLVSYLTTYSGVDYTPGLVAVTLTLPATSTMTDFIPNAGDCQAFRLRNLDSVAATSTTIAAGTGIDLVENENGDVVIEGGNEARMLFCRELDTDVTVYVDEYIAAD